MERKHLNDKKCSAGDVYDTSFMRNKEILRVLYNVNTKPTHTHTKGETKDHVQSERSRGKEPLRKEWREPIANSSVRKEVQEGKPGGMRAIATCTGVDLGAIGQRTESGTDSWVLADQILLIGTEMGPGVTSPLLLVLLIHDLIDGLLTLAVGGVESGNADVLSLTLDGSLVAPDVVYTRGVGMVVLGNVHEAEHGSLGNSLGVCITDALAKSLGLGNVVAGGDVGVIAELSLLVMTFMRGGDGRLTVLEKIELLLGDGSLEMTETSTQGTDARDLGGEFDGSLCALNIEGTHGVGLGEVLFANAVRHVVVGLAEDSGDIAVDGSGVDGSTDVGDESHGGGIGWADGAGGQRGSE